MAKYRVMYWKEIPIQVQAQDDGGQVSQPLDPRFQQGVDSIAMFDGSGGTDDYLMGWEWSDFTETDGSAVSAATRVADHYNNSFPQDFVKRVRDLHSSDNRTPHPGAVDHWCAP